MAPRDVFQVGLLHTCHTAWRRLSEQYARQRSKEQGREAVQLALQKSDAEQLKVS